MVFEDEQRATLDVPPDGWTLEEAFNECLGRAFVDALISDAKDFYATKTPNRKQLRGVDGWRSRRVRERVNWEIKAEFARLLIESRLVAYGRPDTVLNDTKRLRPTAFPALQVLNWRKSILKEHAPVQRYIVDVRVFPFLEAPGTPDIGSETSLSGVCERFVWHDPQVERARREVTLGDDVYSSEMRWAVAPERFALQPGGSEFTARATGEVAALVRRRLDCLFECLADGEVLAIDSLGMVISPGTWANENALIQPAKGNLLVLDPISAEPKRIHLDLKLVLPIAGQESPGEKSVGTGAARVKQTATAELGCCRWLEDVMRKSPNKRTATKRVLQKEAEERWGESLSGRAFERAWADAKKNAKAYSWGLSGRPANSPPKN